jgi:tetratricopeptide (TPR) repeat protein
MNLNKKKYTIISWNQFSTSFNNSFNVPFEDFSDHLSEIRLYQPNDDGNIIIDKDFMIDYNNNFNTVINGNLIVNGNIEINVDEGFGNFLYINGDVTAKSILLSGFPSVEIINNSIIENGIVGMYGDDGGYLLIHGEIITPVVFNCFYFNMIFSGNVNAIVVDASYGELDTNYKKDNLDEIIIDELFDGNEILETKLYDYVKHGKNVVKLQKSFVNKSKVLFKKELPKVNLASPAEKPAKIFNLNDLTKFIADGNYYRTHGDYLQALEYYDKGLNLISLGYVKSDYNLLYIHYSKLWIYSNLAYHKQLEDSLPYKKLCFKEAKLCLSLVPENFSIWHFTEEGQFHDEVIRYSINAIAWYVYETSNNKNSLENALELIDRACTFATNPSTYYIFDTKVRILIKLDRSSEAFQIVKKILKKVPNFSDFQDFKKNQAYLNWLEIN